MFETSSHSQTALRTLLGVCFIAASTVNGSGTQPSIHFRSQSDRSSSRLVGLTDHIHLQNAPDYYAACSVTPEYTRSFKAADLARCLFGASVYDGHRLHISGTQRANRNALKDLAAEHFYLSDAFEGDFTIIPRIQNVLFDADLYIGLNHWHKGLYARITAPFVWTKWNLNAEEKIQTRGNVTDAHGYQGIWNTPGDLLKSFFDYACHEKVPSTQWNSTNNAARIAYPLTNAKICPCSKRKAGLSDIHVELGWDYVRNWYHVGAFAHGVIPTGTRPDGEYLFEPIIGNGKHWELGGGITGHARLWENSNKQQTLTVYGSATLTHMFTARQRRTFDLKAYGQLSRYIQLFAYDGATRETPYRMTPAANLTTQDIHSRVPIHVDSSVMLTYASGKATWDLGYNLWARSCEKLSLAPCACTPCSFDIPLNGTTWAPESINTTIHTLSATPLPEKKLDTTDLDIAGARIRGISHSFFTHVGYSWLEHEYWVPFLGIGVQGEFGNTNNNQCCSTCALSQWSINIKGGASF